MSNDAVNWAYRQKCPSPGAKFVLVTLCDFADEQGFCYPSQKTIGQMTQQGERTVRAHLATLEACGLIRREHRVRPDGTFKSDGFHVQRRNLPTAKMAAGEMHESPAIPTDNPAAKSADGESRRRRKTTPIQRRNSPGMNHQEINHQEIPPTPTKGKRIVPDYTPDFLAFFAAYPKHENKKAAFELWEQINPDADLIATIMAAVARQKTGRKWIEGWANAPDVWLRGAKWEDEPEPLRLPTRPTQAEINRGGQRNPDGTPRWSE